MLYIQEKQEKKLDGVYLNKKKKKMTNWKVSCSRENSTRPHINKETINIVLFNLHLSTGLAVHLEEPQFHGSAPKQPGLIPMNPSQKPVLIEAAEGKIPHLPKFPKYQTRK